MNAQTEFTTVSEWIEQNAAYLLGRGERCVPDEASTSAVRGKTVLITGGGGSIGSELCMQCAAFGAGKIIILDVNENNAFAIRERLAADHPGQCAQVEIASVRDAGRLRRIFAKHRPALVIHAAAHKHVPLMETAAAEAVKNNIFGTVNAADAAEEWGAEGFVLISTDKAVMPTSVMGATKRFCEYIMASRADSPTKFSAVRFGNVLGSAGSVVPSFIRAIKHGEVIRITDARVERYFMTIPEAARLVLCASAMAEQGDIHVLDMGEPIPILTLAERLGELLGISPRIEITALRPGEKLREKLFYGDPAATDSPLILRERPPVMNRTGIADRLRLLADAGDDDDAAMAALREAVTEYQKEVLQ
ncbi:MAG: NAD-dependent epimerase/dehydratase family protein [Ruminococcaceae bacterium]|nr:NAD-dependent epimerase/dehydratase family protein [Oscillospiraceae bacterium]